MTDARAQSYALNLELRLFYSTAFVRIFHFPQSLRRDPVRWMDRVVKAVIAVKGWPIPGPW